MLLNRTTGKLELVVAWGYIDEAILDGLNSGKIETKTFEIGEGIAGSAAPSSGEDGEGSKSCALG